MHIIKQIFEKYGYEFYDNGKPYLLNIFAVRKNQEVTDQFDDDIFCVYRNHVGLFQVKKWPCTTDPGIYWLKNFTNTSGVAILAPGQYVGAYSIDYHQGKYLALCQRLGPVKVFRDNDRDHVYDMNPRTMQEGMYGINIHRSNPYTESAKVDKWSAGCIVFKVADDFDEFMNLCHVRKKMYGNKFTFTLFDGQQFEDYYRTNDGKVA